MKDGCIHAGVPVPIKIDQLKADLDMLIDNGHLDIPTLIEWSNRIDAVTNELTALYELVEVHMPHKTNGASNDLKIGRNSLLSMIFDIHSTQTQFIDGISKIKKRVVKILSGKEQMSLLDNDGEK